VGPERRVDQQRGVAWEGLEQLFEATSVSSLLGRRTR
jgi:hypothetical protein